MSAFTPRRSARLAAKAETLAFTPRRSARLAVNAETPVRAPAHVVVPAAPKKYPLVINAIPSPKKKAVYRSLADMMVDETQSHRENLMRENIDTLIVRQMDAALRCIPDGRDIAAQTVFLYSFIVRPLLDSLTTPYANWDKVPLADLYGIMYYWRPSARTVSINRGMSDKFLHDWNVCRDRMVQYGLIFP